MNGRYGPVFSQYADFGETVPMVPARTSVLAIVALVFAVPCIITGPIGLILGGIALLLIAMSGGRVRGVGLAVAAVVLGLLGTVGQVAVVWGTVQGAKMLVGPTSRIMVATEAGDVAGVQGEMVAGVRPFVTAESVAAFRTAYQAQLGSFTSAPTGIIEYVERVGGMGSTWKSYSGTNRNNEIPVPCDFANQKSLVLLAAARTNVGSPTGLPISDVGITLPDGTDVWLIGGTSPNQDGQPLGAPTAPAAPQAPGSATPDAQPVEDGGA